MVPSFQANLELFGLGWLTLAGQAVGTQLDSWDGRVSPCYRSGWLALFFRALSMTINGPSVQISQGQASDVWGDKG